MVLSEPDNGKETPGVVENTLRANFQQYGRAFLRDVAETAVKHHVILRAPTTEELQTGHIRPGNLVVDHNQTVAEIEMWLCRTFLTTPLDVTTLLRKEPV